MRALVVCALIAACAPAFAEGDYAPDSTAWNGLSELFEVAREAGCEMRAADTLDWSSLDGREVLWFVYPRTSIDADKLARFIAAGGRAVIADDFGAAALALDALGLHRSSSRPEVAPEARFQENPNLPIAHPRLATALGRATPTLIANHPASFATAIPATFEFGPGEALVVEGRLGEGSFVAIADPSVLINNMLKTDPDRAFARALVAHTCRPGRDRILLFSRAFVARGEPPAFAGAPPDATSPFARFNDGMRGLDGWLASSSGRAPLWAFACFFALAALAVLLDTFPPRAALDDRWTRLDRRDSEGDRGEWSGVPWDYALPAALLREELLARLAEALEPSGAARASEAPPAKLDFDWTGPRALDRLIADRFGARAGRTAAELWRLLHRIRWRTADGEVLPDERVSRRHLERMHALAVSLFETIRNPHPPSEV